MKKYLVALPCFKNGKGFCHQTILVKAKNELCAINLVTQLKPDCYIGDIKEVCY